MCITNIRAFTLSLNTKHAPLLTHTVTHNHIVLSYQSSDKWSMHFYDSYYLFYCLWFLVNEKIYKLREKKRKRERRTIFSVVRGIIFRVCIYFNVYFSCWIRQIQAGKKHLCVRFDAIIEIQRCASINFSMCAMQLHLWRNVCGCLHMFSLFVLCRMFVFKSQCTRQNSNAPNESNGYTFSRKANICFCWKFWRPNSFIVWWLTERNRR